jgi:hypothetical protein
MPVSPVIRDWGVREMNIVVDFKSATVPQLLDRIEAGVKELDRGAARVRADIKELKAREPKQWLSLLAQRGIGQSRAYELVSDKTDAELRQASRERKQRERFRDVTESNEDDDGDPYVKEFSGPAEKKAYGFDMIIEESRRNVSDCERILRDIPITPERAAKARRLADTWTMIAASMESKL